MGVQSIRWNKEPFAWLKIDTGCPPDEARWVPAPDCSPAHLGSGTVVGIALGVGAGEGLAPFPRKPEPGHKQSHDSPPAKSGRFLWEILDAMLH